MIKIRVFWSELARTGCILHGCHAEIAHCHGGSIVERMGEPKAKGVKLARMDWLVLPLCPAAHRLGGKRPDGTVVLALDNDVEAWEKAYGKQADYIDYIGAWFSLDLWALARRE